MKKLIITLCALMATVFNTYSMESEYASKYTVIDKQFNAVIVETPALIIIEQGSYHVNITNVSKDDFYKYEMINDTLFIKPKFKIDGLEIMKMKSESLRINLTHPKPKMLIENIQIGSWLDLTDLTNRKNKNKSGNQN